MHTILAERVVAWTERWKAEGLRQGQTQEAQAMLLEAIGAHVGETPDDIIAAVQRVAERTRLHTLLRQAITCPTLDAFRAVLPE